ncbi:DNA polymerase III subunit gamma/tau [Laceyella putida]|uniref:DNA-directed DNA polymerase n=1 Tax=Laceyella putida TaxID=110101 RepID=A0ABW2RGX4_9BACL
MSYRALYRVWRPQRFEDLVGQEHVTKTLKNALKEKHLSHAYLFNGPRGTGKTSAAKIFAKAVNCVHGPAPEPCNECEACKRITEGAIMDVVEIDAASNRGVDEIRELRDKVKYAPTEVRYKVYIIDEVHMLTTEAFNALLKTLEEPPTHVIFILATTEPHKLPPTIISRCQRFSFRRISFEHIVARMKLICESMGISYEETALYAVARAADGGMRDALSLLDQALAFAGDRLDEQAVMAVTGAVSKEIVLHMLQAVADASVPEALKRLDEAVMAGMEPEKLIQDFIHAVRDVLLYKTAPQLEGVKSSLGYSELFPRLSERLSIGRLTQMLDLLLHYQQQMKWVAHPRIVLEMALLRLIEAGESEAKQDASVPVAKLEERIRELEQALRKLQAAPSASAERTAPSTPESPKQPAIGKSQPRFTSLNEQWFTRLSAEKLKEVRRVWPEVLHRVKEDKIMVHAWLVDGEVVGATQDTVVVAFRSKIHCETVENKHKDWIQQVMAQAMGTPMRLKTIMMPEWQEFMNRHGKQAKDEPEEPDEPSGQDDIIKKAIGLFGEQLVKVIDQN